MAHPQASRSSRNASGNKPTPRGAVSPRDLIGVARHLVTRGVSEGMGRPRQAELRRAVSAAYYALFHALALSCATTLVGSAPRVRGQLAWRRAYRALEHGHARAQCENRSGMVTFPTDLQVLGRQFVDTQQQRHRADYDPLVSFSRSEVLNLITETESVIARFENTSASHRRPFAIHVLLRPARG